MAPSDDLRCRGAGEPHASLIRISTEHSTLSSDLIIDPLPQPSFASNVFKVKTMKACQKGDFATMM